MRLRSLIKMATGPWIRAAFGYYVNLSGEWWLGEIHADMGKYSGREFQVGVGPAGEEVAVSAILAVPDTSQVSVKFESLIQIPTNTSRVVIRRLD
jgi:hypothetical protein